jgi:hypothetical protein
MTKKKEDVVWYKVVNNKRRSVVVDRYNTNPFIINALALTYNKGEIVKAKRGSYGCFCFKDQYAAESFSREEARSIVIRVRPIGTIKPVPKRIPGLKTTSLDYVKDAVKKLRSGQLVSVSWEVPASTVCCTAVEVLD